MDHSRIFLLSPAFCAGRRAKILLREDSDAPLALRLRTGTLTIGDAFAFLSGLYFRGKLAYGRAFGRRPGGSPATLIITPSRGLVSPDLIVDAALLREFAGVDVAIENPRYRDPLDRDASALAVSLEDRGTIVLLGSVASGKYGDVLAPWFGDRLMYPSDFVGRGDMSRGGLLLRRVASGEELTYTCLRCGDRPTGARPPKLPRTTVLLAGLTIFCGSPPASPSGSAALHPCTIGRVAATCGSMPVFEHRDTKRGRQIDIHFAILPGPDQTPRRAVFEFAGGPGEGSTDLVSAADGWIAPVRGSADLVFVDQRGTGHSHPLACGWEAAAASSAFGHVFDPDAVRRCRLALEKDADLTQYTTDIAAADIDDVRATLGYESISIYGGSYGTRLALAYMRRFPAHTRAVILDGVVPPDLVVPLTYAASAEASLQRVFEACAADFPCGATHPHLAADFASLLQRLDRGPLPATVRPQNGPSLEVKMTRGDFGYAVRGLLYNAGIAPRLADMIKNAAATNRLDAFGQAYLDRKTRLDRAVAFGQHLSVFCAEDVPFASDDEIAAATASTFLGRYLFDEYRAACREWPRAPIAADTRTPVTSRVPTLLVSGAFDPVTPPAFAEHVQRTLPLAGRLVSPTAAHGAAAGCPRDLVLAVLEKGSIDLVSDACR